MNPEEKVVMDSYTDQGIELPPEATPVPEPEGDEPAPEPATPEEPEAEPEGTPDGEPEAIEPLQNEPKEPKKRSIYNDLKDTRNDLKSEREAREKAERELTELRSKLDGKPPVESKADDLDAFAAEIGADPQAIKKMHELFLKNMPASTISPELQTKLEQFEKWQETNSSAIEAQQFETEFQSAIPQLQKLFPNASKEDIVAMKSEIDNLAHTPEYHDKEIDYIAFRNQDKLATIVTPRKRGLESKGRVDATHTPSTFDPNADITKMSPKEAEAWEKGYNELTKNSELTNDSIGRRVML
jgi:hypothetical protein